MRSANKRSRSKSNRPKSLGNIVNRVFDSSGPEGKVRGTPQQIIEKYQVLARDAQLSNDRVAAENFQQHAEHYTRLLAQAMREQQAEQEARRQQQEERNRGQQEDRGQGQGHGQRRNEHRRGNDGAQNADGPREPQRSDAFALQDDEPSSEDRGNLVDTPEAEAREATGPGIADSVAPAENTSADAGAASDAAPQKRAPRRQPRARKPAATEGDEAAPKPARNTRKPRKSASDKAQETEQSAPGTPSAAAE